MAETTVRVDWVRVEGRHRKDLGDIESLAKSIAGKHGLMNAITVTPDGRLIAGERRLAAVKLLGWQVIDARIIDSLDDAAALIVAEREENTERKDMTASELVSLGLSLEELERPKAKERQGTRTDLRPPRELSDTDTNKLPTREVVAKALGWGASTYERAKAVVEAAHDHDAPSSSSESRRQGRPVGSSERRATFATSLAAPWSAPSPRSSLRSTTLGARRRPCRRGGRREHHQRGRCRASPPARRPQCPGNDGN